jgi:hypothetical protein
MDIAWSHDRLKDVEDQFQYIQGNPGNFSYHFRAMHGQAPERFSCTDRLIDLCEGRILWGKLPVNPYQAFHLT